MKIKAIITGSTGMVGKAVLLECIEDEEVESILLINRRTAGILHEKVREVLVKDFTDFSSIDEDVKGYNACFHCMGVSAVGMSEQQYNTLTYDVTKALADLLMESTNGDLVFNYVSGTGTDSTEKGRSMWARVKGKTENLILSMEFKDAYAFRPGFILPEKGVKSSTGWYNAIYVLLKPFFPLFRNNKNITSSSRIGKAMINSLRHPTDKKHLENKDINKLADV
jgi:nucleoside-diphosphate-sugar epimerase